MTYTFDPQILIRLRKAQFWTQEDLSAASGVSVRTIQRIEREGGGSLESWKGLAAAFDVPVETLQSNSSQSRFSPTQKRVAFIMVCFGFAFALLMNGFAWGAMLNHLFDQSADLRPHSIMLMIYGLGLALAFFPPVFFWKKYQR